MKTCNNARTSSFCLKQFSMVGHSAGHVRQQTGDVRQETGDVRQET